MQQLMVTLMQERLLRLDPLQLPKQQSMHSVMALYEAHALAVGTGQVAASALALASGG
jgi:Na+/alanine symporter